MEAISLIEPTPILETEYKSMLAEWQATGEKLVPKVMVNDPTNFEAFLELIDGFKFGKKVSDEDVPSSTFWLVKDGHHILGVVNIRHYLNDRLHKMGGHIGYGIRPSAREMGYATEILRLALLEAKKMGINRALLSCEEGNIASKKVIEKNGGIAVYENDEDSSNHILRFWINMR